MRPYKLLHVLSLIFLSCAENNQQRKEFAAVASEPTHNVDSVETFASFNKRFHSDSGFQLSRIAFPIGGNYITAENSHGWTAGNWELLREPVRETVNINGYKHDLQKSDTTVIEIYWIESSGFRSERRFKQINGKWFLSYYDDIDL